MLVETALLMQGLRHRDQRLKAATSTVTSRRHEDRPLPVVLGVHNACRGRDKPHATCLRGSPRPLESLGNGLGPGDWKKAASVGSARLAVAEAVSGVV